jgi:hypothetical protein
MLREPALGMYTVPYRRLGDPGSEACCYRDCTAPATCWVEGNGQTWAVMITPLHPAEDEIRQAYEFCAAHGPGSGTGQDREEGPPAGVREA